MKEYKIVYKEVGYKTLYGISDDNGNVVVPFEKYVSIEKINLDEFLLIELNRNNNIVGVSYEHIKIIEDKVITINKFYNVPFRWIDDKFEKLRENNQLKLIHIFR